MGLEGKALFDVRSTDFGELPVVDDAITIAIRKTQDNMNLKSGQIELFATTESIFTFSDGNFTSVVFVLPGELPSNKAFQIIHILLHYF